VPKPYTLNPKPITPTRRILRTLVLSTQKFKAADGDGDEEITLQEYRQLFFKKKNLYVVAVHEI
jgi:hypothetical protein